MLEFRDLLIIALIIYWIGRFFSNCYTKAKDNTKDKQIKTLKAEYDKRLKQLSDKYDNSISILTAERDNALKELDKHATNISLLISSNITSMPWLAGMMADYLTYDLEIEAKKLDWGSNVQREKKVASIRAIRADAQKRIEEAKVATYQLDYLRTLYPALDDNASPDAVKGLFITNTNLSNKARSVANALRITVVENHAMTDFPRIKCNIGRGEFGERTQIYHLPMDAQYDMTQITKSGEFYAFTVKEAVDAGFRRAYKWRQ